MKYHTLKNTNENKETNELLKAIDKGNKMKITEDKITTYKVNKLRRALVLEFMDMGLTFKEADKKANVLFHRTFINDKPIIGRPYVTTIQSI